MQEGMALTMDLSGGRWEQAAAYHLRYAKGHVINTGEPKRTSKFKTS